MTWLRMNLKEVELLLCSFLRGLLGRCFLGRSLFCSNLLGGRGLLGWSLLRSDLFRGRGFLSSNLLGRRFLGGRFLSRCLFRSSFLCGRLLRSGFLCRCSLLRRRCRSSLCRYWSRGLSWFLCCHNDSPNEQFSPSCDGSVFPTFFVIFVLCAIPSLHFCTTHLRIDAFCVRGIA